MLYLLVVAIEMKTKAILLLFYLSPFIIVSFYNHPAIDDFWSANTIVAVGRIAAVKFFFQTISPRYFSHFLMSLCNTLPSGNLFIFKVWPIIVILLLTCSFIYLYTSLFQNLHSENTYTHIGKRKFVLAAIVYVALHLANIRVLFDGLYWMSSTVCYQIGICLFAVGLGAVVQYIRFPSLSTAFLAISASILLPGSIELLGPVYFFVLLVILLISKNKGWKTSVTGMSLAASVVSLIVILCSKGTAARVEIRSTFQLRELLAAVFYSFRAVAYYCYYWLTTPINIALLILMLHPLNDLAKRLTLPDTYFVKKPFLLLPLFFFLCVLIFLPQMYLESTLPFPRVTTLVFFVAAHFVVVFFLIVLHKESRFSRFLSNYSALKHTRNYLWALFFISAFTSTNFLLVMKDLVSGNARVFDQEAKKRYEVIKNTKSDTCYVPHYSKWPHFVQSSKTENFNFERMNIYFGKTILYKEQ